MNTELKVSGVEPTDVSMALQDAKSTSSVVLEYEKVTLLNEKLHELMDTLTVEEKKKRRWQRVALGALILLLVILLYSCSTILFGRKYEVKSYNAVLTADLVAVDATEISSMTANEILEESQQRGYVSNTKEFYYDPTDAVAYGLAEGNTRYYDIDSLNKAIMGKVLNYSLTSLVETDKPVTSKTEVANKVFSYGYADGSAQMALPESEKLIFSGYTKELVDRYLDGLHLDIYEESAVPVVINADIEVTEDFVNAMLSGVVKDAYMQNTGEVIKSVPFYYGFDIDAGELIYIPSHPASKGTDYGQVPEPQIITDLVEQNIEAYLGEDVEISTKIPLTVKKPTTVIYLSTENYVYDNFYLASLLGLY